MQVLKVALYRFKSHFQCFYVFLLYGGGVADLAEGPCNDEADH